MNLRLAEGVLKTFQLHFERRMALLTQVLNPMTGQNEWQVQSDDYDYHQEVACAGFGDMLHDTERNRKYFAALRKTISKMHAEGRKVNVLDIGTGTGILAMMAVEAGADAVTACEAFMPMANCAERILEANGMADKVRLIKKRSTDVKIGEDMPVKANLLVTEVLDTELIGEGAIGIYNHAHATLLTDDVVCIPARATCYAQVVQSPLAAQWNSMKALADLDGDVLLQPPKEVLECKGEHALHDVQLSQLPSHQFRLLTAAIEIFDFDFNRKAARELERSKNVKVKSLSAGSTDMVFYWWDIKMDIEDEIVLSCAPYWAHPEFKQLLKEKSPVTPVPNVIPWRDHWMQAIYYIPKPLHLTTPGVEFLLHCNHDEYSLWFDASLASQSELDQEGLPKKKPLKHTCTCDLHMTYARNRIGQMNQSQRNKKYLNYFEESLSGDSHVLSLGDGCLLGLAASKLGAGSVTCHEPHRFSRRFLETVARKNNLTNHQFIEQLDTLQEDTIKKFTHIFAEPYFLTSILPWDNFYFGTLLSKIRKHLSPTVQISPHSARIMAMPVEFLDLHKIRTPIKMCEGFDLSLFDKMVETSITVAQGKVEAQPLWEYPCRALAQPQEILNVKFKTFDDEDINTQGLTPIEESSPCNGIALWVDWHIDDSNRPKSIISTGPTEPITVGDFIKWDMFTRQGVQLLGAAKQLHKNKSHLRWSVDFQPKLGQIKFNFSIES